ncbi:YqgQ family protein [Salibacterium qingdaonense]|uniref:YqgQ family protein n=1 Tax=Salibacterium qingdaonense TaxID=266892 RepID=UPI000B83646F|nr:YqgQ family protein [Salibacterium qingdaonense]
MNTDFQTLADIRKWLIQFRTVIYTKDRRMDLELLEEEVKGAHEAGLMDNKNYTNALMIIRNEYNQLD